MSMYSKMILRYLRRRRFLIICVLCIFTIHFCNIQCNISVEFRSIHDPIKALLYRVLNIPTDRKIYLNESQKVFDYSRYNLQYLVNNQDICAGNYPLVLIFVKVHSGDFEARKVIRETWGNIESWKEFGVKRNEVIVIFSLGTTERYHLKPQAAVQKENDIHHDIIQENYIENFHNLTIKVVSQLKWPLRYCREAAFWMTTDSDVFVHVGNLVSHLKKQRPHGYYSGLVHTGAHRISDRSSKYYVSSDIYKGAYYPDYCAGAGYVISMDVAEKLFNKVRNIPLLYIDDAYIGFLAHSCGVQPIQYVMFMGEKKASTGLCTLSKFLTSHGHTKEQMKAFYHEIMTLSVLNPDIACWNKFLSWVNPFDLVIF